jgi:hypothetical protein
LRLAVLLPYLLGLSYAKRQGESKLENLNQDNKVVEAKMEPKKFLFPKAPQLLLEVQAILRNACDGKIPRRTPIDSLFEGFCQFELGSADSALRALDRSYSDSKIQGNFLCESLSLLLLAIAKSNSASTEQILECAQIFREKQWVLLLRVAREFAVRLGIGNLEEESFAHSVESLSHRQTLTNRAAQEILTRFKNSSLFQSEFEIKQTVVELALKLVQGRVAWLLGAGQSNTKVPKYVAEVKIGDLDSENAILSKLLKLVPANAQEPFLVLGIRDFASPNYFEKPQFGTSDLDATLAGDNTLPNPDAPRTSSDTLGLESGPVLLVAVTYGTSLFGWVAVLCSHQTITESTEQDFLILGLHTGFLIHKNRLAQNQEGIEWKKSSEPQMEKEKLPAEVFKNFFSVQSFHSGEKAETSKESGVFGASARTGMKFLSLGKSRKIVVLWNVGADGIDVLNNVLVHLQIVAEAVAQALVYQPIGALTVRIVSEIQTLVQNSVQNSEREKLLSCFDLNVVCFDFVAKDMNAKECFCVCGEIIFGDDLFVINGKSKLESEITREVSGVLAERRWYIQERVRAIGSEKFGWLGYPQNNRLGIFVNFVKANVLDDLKTQTVEKTIGIEKGVHPYLVLVGGD